MKQTKFLIPLLMAIVMMAMSPAKAWAEKTFKILVSDDATSATLLYDEDSHRGSIILYSMSEFNNWRNNIKNITLDPSMADYRPTDCSEWFYGFSGVTTINGLEYLNTSEVTSMYRMFRNCRKLTSLNLSNFDVSKVTNMAEMLYECQALSSITFPASFNTSKVTNMSLMFFNCQTLTSLDVSCFDTQEVTNMESMFSGCQNLTSLSVSSFNTCNVEDMSYLFQNCKNLSSLSLANFNTEKVTTMELMFYNCSGLTSLDLSSFVPKNVTTMKQMFEGCTKLASIDLSNFNTAKVTNMSRMFYQCYELTSLDLSGFNTAKVTNMNQMFHQSAKLKNFTFGNFDMSNVTNISNMFYQCFAENKTLTFKSVPFLKDGSFNSALTGVTSVTYQLDDRSIGHTGTNYLPNATSATYSHEMSNEYETLVLPFAVTYTADNGNYKLYNLSGATGSDLYITEYANGAEIAAGTPMAVKAVGSKNGAGKYEISFAGSGAVNTTITPVTKGSITFTGTYSDVKLNAGAGCTFDGEKFVCTTEQVTESPFRCYITASAEELPAELRLVEHTHTEVTDAEVPATCTTGLTAGKHCSVCGEVLEGLEVIPALGHDYHVLLDENEKPVFVWSEDCTTATLQLVCSHNAEHTANVEVTGEGITSAVTTPATCTAGVRTYTAKATYEGETYTGTKEVEIAALGHNFVNGVCEYCSVTQLTYISGSEGFYTEGPEKLIDGDDDTKWCSDWSVDNKPYIIFKTAAPASISGYSMVHGNDTPTETDRAWKAWTIYGANFDSDEEATAASEAWQEVDSRSGYNYGSEYSFSDLTCESYQYYKIVIDSNVFGNTQQMAEIHFTLSCAHSGDKIEHSASEATAEYHGNGVYKVCAQCGACLDAEGNVIARPVIHYFDDEHTHARIEPTCTAVGSIAYKECVVCNKFFDMDNNPVSSTVIDMIEHTFDSDGKCTECPYVCEHSEYSSFDSDTHRCTICQQSESHTFDETGICEVCGGYQKPEGEGTEQSPYLIANKGNILWVDNSLDNAQVKLVADVIITDAISVGSGKELTVNLDGHALTGEGIDIFSVTGGTLNLRDAESNAGKLTKGNHGVMITDGGTFNMYGGSITECTSQGSAGVAVNVNDGTFNMFGGAITGNQVGTILYNRGVVYVHPNNGYFNMQGGSITNNSGKTYGVGVYCVAESDGSDPSDHDGGEACFAAGTLVTMADGSKKAIEDVAIGESVLTMNHDTGEMTAETVFFVHNMEMDGAFTLHFSNGTDVTVVKYHDFFEKDNNRYVTLATQNASSYIGRSFYCAESNEWVELTGVTPIKGTVGTYGLLVAHTFNNLANGMLTAIMPPYPVYNAFEFGDNLIIDQEKKAADIALYGIMDYEEVKDAMSREFFDTVNGQYARVLIGKGMATLEDCLRMVTIYFPQNNAKLSARCRAGEVNPPHVTLSGKVIISDNKKTDDNSPSNLAVSEGMLSIGTLEAGSMIGIDLCMSNKESENSTNKKTDRVYGVVASDAVDGDVQYFTADNPLAGITYNEGKLAIHLHSFDNKTLTAEPVADGLYAYACDVDGCGAHTDDHIVKNGEGENTTIIELTDDGEGNFSAASVDVADGQTFQTPVEFTVQSDQVTVERTFTASKPATVMLPFTIDASLIQGATFSAFGGVSYDAEKEQWVATMTSVATGNLQAYKPYIVMLDEGNETGKVTFGNTSADVATFVATPDASAMQTADENGWTFKAVNAAKTWAEGDPEIGKAYGFAGKDKTVGDNEIHQGDFVKIAADASAKPGRCYLVKNDGEPLTRATEELPATIKVRFIVGSATGIGTLDTETGEMTLEGWYDLNGNKIEQPSKGIVYINNNKKVMVK